MCAPTWVRLCCVALALVGAAASGCRRAHKAAPVVARWSNGEVTEADLDREASRMPVALRQQFESPYGRRELASALVDKQLLVEEARRRGLTDRPEIRKQVEDLEGRLAVQALVAEEEKQVGPSSEAERRAWYAAHASELRQPARVRVSRVLVRLDKNASQAERSRARARVDALVRRLKAGEPFARVAAQGDGPERAREGDIGFVVEHGPGDPAQQKAALALTRAGELSPPVDCQDGIAVLRLVERREARVPTFEEAGGEVANRMAPERQRKVFEALLQKLRGAGKVTLADVKSSSR